MTPEEFMSELEVVKLWVAFQYEAKHFVPLKILPNSVKNTFLLKPNFLFTECSQPQLFTMCFDQLWPFFGCVRGVCGRVALKQRSSYSAIIHLVQWQAAAALLTLSLWVAGYNSRWTAVDTGPHSHIPPWEKKWRSKSKRRQI